MSLFEGAVLPYRHCSFTTCWLCQLVLCSQLYPSALLCSNKLEFSAACEELQQGTDTCWSSQCMPMWTYMVHGHTPTHMTYMVMARL